MAISVAVVVGRAIVREHMQVMLLCLSLAAVCILANRTCAETAEEDVQMRAGDAIQPYSVNPRYWQYREQPVLLLGGTVEDNLFQIPDLKQHLDLLKSVGGNTIRNVMSSRDPGNVWPFLQIDGKYDLDQWNDEYWDRFQRMLQWTHEREIFPQVEVWAFHDFNQGPWKTNPWNPANTTSYSTGNTTLKEHYGNIGHVRHGFFTTVPNLEHDEIVLRYQQKFVDKMLSYTLQYDHVLYCMTNEIHPQFSPEWGWYWADYIKAQARASGRAVETTEMFWEPDLTHEQHRASLDHPEIYSYFEASQNSAVKDGDQNWANLQAVYHMLDEQPRPINHTKIYGADTGPSFAGNDDYAGECFWRNIFGGSASSRFHRPPTGIALSKAAQTHIRSMRLLLAELDIFHCVPDSDHSLLQNRNPNSAYLTYIPGHQYAVYFPNDSGVMLDLPEASGTFRVRWLNIGISRWLPPARFDSGRPVQLQAPGAGDWVALIRK